MIRGEYLKCHRPPLVKQDDLKMYLIKKMSLALLFQPFLGLAVTASAPNTLSPDEAIYMARNRYAN